MQDAAAAASSLISEAASIVDSAVSAGSSAFASVTSVVGSAASAASYPSANASAYPNAYTTPAGTNTTATGNSTAAAPALAPAVPMWLRIRLRPGSRYRLRLSHSCQASTLEPSTAWPVGIALTICAIPDLYFVWLGLEVSRAWRRQEREAPVLRWRTYITRTTAGAAACGASGIGLLSILLHNRNVFSSSMIVNISLHASVAVLALMSVGFEIGFRSSVPAS
ncbi:uncharacterized protein COLE_00968 [Cutaneotrichosporon oleaginosum]|uniref:uncharacterized protein n=1 Tax=Cutaneotrichosporon oleaginosum TaxID=879819 RepID=UPI001324F3ED|nr:hypothetical protein COLE_00968 [Cutaneotrichosporon oleaginosum]